MKCLFSEKIVSIQFMKKYIHIAKAIKPKLTAEACHLICEEYAKLRSFDNDGNDMARTQPVTARTLETLIRLATAHARARLSKNVEAQDANCATELVQFAIFHKVLSRPKKRKREDQQNEEEEEEEEDMEVDEEQEVRPKQTRRTKRERTTDDPYEFDEEEVEEEAKQTKKASQMETVTHLKLSEERLKQFRSFLFKEFRKTHSQSLPLQQIYDSAEKETELKFSKEEVDSALNTMQNDLNQIFVSNNIVILV